MHFTNQSWPIDKLVKMSTDINPKPQYQRGPVWRLVKKQLLIDSIVNRFDIPKIYLRHTASRGIYRYEVADGQQRLTAIWQFINNEFPLGHVQGRNHAWTGKNFSELSCEEKKHILTFEIIVVTVDKATNDDIRELFARLQKGERLTPPELRNSLASAIGDTIRAMAQTHSFFHASPFVDQRFKRDDLLAHAFAIELYSGSRDLKAPQLSQMYVEHNVAVDEGVTRRVNAVLSYLAKMQKAIPSCIKTKWGFIDVFWLVSKNLGSLPPAKELAERYVIFEKDRLQHTKEPEQLISRSSPRRDKQMYDYIMAFNVGGSLKENIAVRQRIIAKKLL